MVQLLRFVLTTILVLMHLKISYAWFPFSSCIFAFVPPERKLASNKHAATTPQYENEVIQKREVLPSEQVVTCTISRDLPHATIQEAKEAWLEYHWRRGGGILGIWVDTDENSKEAPSSRTILPIFMTETLLDKNGKDSENMIQYKVQDAGFLFNQFIVPNSHQGVVKFFKTTQKDTEKSSSDTGCRMEWHVSFATTGYSSIFRAVTDFTIATASRTVQEACAEPRIFKIITKLPPPSKPGICLFDADAACRRWLDFAWNNGGGLPWLTFSLGRRNDNNVTLHNEIADLELRHRRFPPLLSEQITELKFSESLDGGNGYAQVSYELKQPGWTALPLLLHTYQATVRFYPSQDKEGEICMEWTLYIRPFEVTAPIVEKIISMTTSTIVRNFRIHLKDPEATVAIKPPRGAGEQVFGSVRKDSWLGGVLAAHLQDTRSTVQQTMSLFQPWTWGRSGDGSNNDEVQFSWTKDDGESTMSNDES